jgi:hypothetical protein
MYTLYIILIAHIAVSWAYMCTACAAVQCADKKPPTPCLCCAAIRVGGRSWWTGFRSVLLAILFWCAPPCTSATLWDRQVRNLEFDGSKRVMLWVTVIVFNAEVSKSASLLLGIVQDNSGDPMGCLAMPTDKEGFALLCSGYRMRHPCTSATRW